MNEYHENSRKAVLNIFILTIVAIIVSFLLILFSLFVFIKSKYQGGLLFLNLALLAFSVSIYVLIEKMKQKMIDLIKNRENELDSEENREIISSIFYVTVLIDVDPSNFQSIDELKGKLKKTIKIIQILLNIVMSISFLSFLMLIFTIKTKNQKLRNILFMIIAFIYFISFIFTLTCLIMMLKMRKTLKNLPESYIYSLVSMFAELYSVYAKYENGVTTVKRAGGSVEVHSNGRIQNINSEMTVVIYPNDVNVILQNGQLRQIEYIYKDSRKTEFYKNGILFHSSSSENSKTFNYY